MRIAGGERVLEEGRGRAPELHCLVTTCGQKGAHSTTVSHRSRVSSWTTCSSVARLVRCSRRAPVSPSPCSAGGNVRRSLLLFTQRSDFWRLPSTGCYASPSNLGAPCKGVRRACVPSRPGRACPRARRMPRSACLQGYTCTPGARPVQGWCQVSAVLVYGVERVIGLAPSVCLPLTRPVSLERAQGTSSLTVVSIRREGLSGRQRSARRPSVSDSVHGGSVRAPFNGLSEPFVEEGTP